MKTTKNVETTITVGLTAQDVLAYVREKKLVPDDWKFYSVEVTGSGISNGAEITIKHREAHSSENMKPVR